MDKLDNMQPLFSNVVAGAHAAAAQGNTPSVSQVAAAATLSLPPPLQSRPPPASQTVYTTKPRAQTNVPIMSHPSAQSSMPAVSVPAQENSWSIATRRRATKVIRGTAPVAGLDSNNSRAGWTSAPRDIFVYHTSHHTTEDDISDLMTVQSKVSPIKIEKRSKEFAYFGSFRVSVRRDDFEEATKAEHWPAGWSIREYYVSRQRKEVERLQRAAAADGAT